MAGAKHRHTKLLEDPKVKEWYDELTLGSPRTAKNYLRMLGYGCEQMKTTPQEFLAMAPEKQVELLRGYVNRHRDRYGAKPATKTVKKALVSWLKSNGKDSRLLADVVSTKGSHIARRENVDLPTRADLRKVLLVSSPQVRAAVAILAFAGQRIEVLGTRLEEDGKTIADGLRYSDFPEARFEAGRLVFDRVPAFFYVRSSLDKLHRPDGYFAFLGPEGCEYLQAYVAERVRLGEKVTRNSPVITHAERSFYNGDYEFLHPNNIGDAVRKVYLAVGLGKHVGEEGNRRYVGPKPYDLRSYFSQNSEAGVKDGLNVDYKEYWMGHAPHIKQLYSLRDAKQLAEPMRDMYAAVCKHIETTVLLDATPTRVEVFKSILSALHTEEELAEMTDEQIIAEGQEAINLLRARSEEKVVEMGDLEAALAEGWATKLALPNGKVVVTKTAVVGSGSTPGTIHPVPVPKPLAKSGFEVA